MLALWWPNCLQTMLSKDTWKEQNMSENIIVVWVSSSTVQGGSRDPPGKQNRL